MFRATKRIPDHDWNYLLLAGAYGHLSRDREAKQAVTTFNSIRYEKGGKKPPFTLAGLKYWSIKNEIVLLRLREGMRKAGVPAS